MRPLIFGSPEDARMQSVKAELEAQGLRPVFRNPAFFKATEIEKADLVVIGEEALLAGEIRTAYEGHEAEVRVLDAPEPCHQDVSTLHITIDSPEIKALLDEASQKLASMEALLAEKDARIAELEALLDEGGDSEESQEIDALKGKIADLEAKKAAGTMAKTEPALLARYVKKLETLTAPKE